MVNSRYSFKNEAKFRNKSIHMVTYGTETVAHIGPKVWNLLPNRFKLSTTVEEFKIKVKMWIPKNCPCRSCKNYLQRTRWFCLTIFLCYSSLFLHYLKSF